MERPSFRMSWGPRAALGSGTRGDWLLASGAVRGGEDAGSWREAGVGTRVGGKWPCGGPPWSGRGGDAGTPSERGRAGPSAGDQPHVLGMRPVDGGAGLALERSRERRRVCISSTTRMFHQRPAADGREVYTLWCVRHLTRRLSPVNSNGEALLGVGPRGLGEDRAG